MPMYSALYYPHTSVQNPGLIRTALLFWDELHYIVPWEGFTVRYEDPEEQEALELIGRARVPSEKEQLDAHALIEDFVTRPLPAAFQYAADLSRSTYELYPQKLMDRSWNLLRDMKLVGQPLANADVPSTNETGMSVMSILADCCAGDSLARVTDHDAAYAVIAGALVETEPQLAIENARRELTPIALEVASLDHIPLRKLIDFRGDEAKNGPSSGTTKLRHNLVDDMNEQTKALAVARTEADRDELKRLYKQKLALNLRDLREALKLESTQILGSKSIIAAAIGVVGAAIASLAMPPVTVPGAVIAIGGLLSTRSAFARKRSGILEKNPMAYLYEAAGGFVRY
jgi:hypothetical protein